MFIIPTPLQQGYINQRQNVPHCPTRLRITQEPHRIPTHCCSIDQLESSGVLTLIHRRSDYNTAGHEPRGYVEPELIALVGVSHLSSASADAVTKVIQHFQPEAVVVELCRSRFSLLYDPSELKTIPLRTRKSSFLVEGISNSVFQFILSSFLRTATDGGRKVGAEFRAARAAAQQCNAEVVLGDRPIELTLNRAWRALSLKEKLVLFTALVRGAMGISGGLDDVKDKQLRETINTGIEAEQGLMKKYVDMLKESFPGVVTPLIEERDLYLAWSLKRSQAVKGRKCVVGVVGKAHVEGIIACMKEDDEYRRKGEKPPLTFRDLVR